MGMYTELVLKADVKKDLSSEVEDVLQFLFNRRPEPNVLPDHEFFKCDRWRSIGNSNSFYHVPFALSRYEDGYIFSRSDLKNYDAEIEKFLDWIKPYLDDASGKCIGWYWYEESDMPTLLVMPEGEPK